MATGTDIKTFYEGSWHEGDISVIKAADHGAWLGTTVFDGARLFDGLSPDLEAHCARINRSAQALMITPTVDTETMVATVREGLAAYPREPIEKPRAVEHRRTEPRTVIGGFHHTQVAVVPGAFEKGPYMCARGHGSNFRCAGAVRARCDICLRAGSMPPPDRAAGSAIA